MSVNYSIRYHGSSQVSPDVTHESHALSAIPRVHPMHPTLIQTQKKTRESERDDFHIPARIPKKRMLGLPQDLPQMIGIFAMFTAMRKKCGLRLK
jgi:hypothetical protein